MIDILIPLNNGSRYGDMELKYCLRSICKHLSGVRNLVIVGERPWFMNESTYLHIPYVENTNSWRRAHNIYSKIMAGINHISDLQMGWDTDDIRNHTVTVSALAVSDTFLFMNDDHFLLSDYNAEVFPYYYRKMDLPAFEVNQPQLKQMRNTIDALHKLNLATSRDYDIHCPILYNKNEFRRIFGQLPGQWPEYGYGIKTFYTANKKYVNWVEEVEDLKFKEPLLKTTIYRALAGRKWFSVGDRALKHGDMKAVLQELYPDPSPYEL